MCSYTVDTPHTDVKTAAIYNAIIQILGLIFAGILLSVKPNTFGQAIT